MEIKAKNGSLLIIPSRSEVVTVESAGKPIPERNGQFINGQWYRTFSLD